MQLGEPRKSYRKPCRQLPLEFARDVLRPEEHVLPCAEFHPQVAPEVIGKLSSDIQLQREPGNAVPNRNCSSRRQVTNKKMVGTRTGSIFFDLSLQYIES